MSALDKLLDLWPRHYPPAADARAELERLRIIEAWVLEHAQHGGSCPYWGPYEEADRQQCTCGLAEIMEGMK